MPGDLSGSPSHRSRTSIHRLRGFCFAGGGSFPESPRGTWGPMRVLQWMGVSWFPRSHRVPGTRPSHHEEVDTCRKRKKGRLLTRLSPTGLSAELVGFIAWQVRSRTSRCVSFFFCWSLTLPSLSLSFSLFSLHTPFLSECRLQGFLLGRV